VTTLATIEQTIFRHTTCPSLIYGDAIMCSGKHTIVTALITTSQGFRRMLEVSSPLHVFVRPRRGQCNRTLSM